MLGLNLCGVLHDNADVVEEDWNDYEDDGWPDRSALADQPGSGTPTLSLITQYSDADGDWESDPAVGDYKIVTLLR